MSQSAYPSRSTGPEVVEHPVQIEGAGASAPVKSRGSGITVTRVSTGLYRFTWADNPGEFAGMRHSFGADTQTDVDGHTAVRGAYSSANRRVDVEIRNAAAALADLGASEYLDVQFLFARTSVQ